DELRAPRGAPDRPRGRARGAVRAPPKESRGARRRPRGARPRARERGEPPAADAERGLRPGRCRRGASPWPSPPRARDRDRRRTRTDEGEGVADRADGRVEPASARADGAGRARGCAPGRGPAGRAGSGARGGAARLRGLSLRRAAPIGALPAGCALRPPAPPGGIPTEPQAFEDDLDVASLRQAIERMTASATSARLLQIIETVRDPAARAEAIGRSFRVVRLSEPLLLTAYYEPELAARRTADEHFRYPIYARPADLVDVDPSVLDESCACRRAAGRVEGNRLRPYPSRAEIDAGALAGRDLEIGWTPDPVQLFALHVQGSGRLRFEDGTVAGAGYAGTNGRPYRSIAPALVARGLLPVGPTTWPEIRAALATLSPDEQAAVLATNERYTFFRLTRDADPVGS